MHFIWILIQYKLNLLLPDSQYWHEIHLYDTINGHCGIYLSFFIKINARFRRLTQKIDIHGKFFLCHISLFRISWCRTITLFRQYLRVVKNIKGIPYTLWIYLFFSSSNWRWALKRVETTYTVHSLHSNMIIVNIYV